MTQVIQILYASNKLAIETMANVLKKNGYTVGTPETCDRMQVSDAELPHNPPRCDVKSLAGKDVWMVIARR